jgi:hypothetical protein
MTVKVRALWVLALLGATMWLAGCGHYICGAGFGDTTCASGTGTTNGSSSQRAFVYFMDDHAGQMAAVAMDLDNSGTFAPIANWAPPPSLILKGHDGGMVIINKLYLYMPYSDGSLHGYTIDSTTGALSVSSTTALNLPSLVESPIAADPSGKFLFVGTASGVYALTVNSSSGAVALVNGSPFASGIGQPVQMSTDGTGKYLYAMDGTNISEFSYDSSTGALTNVGTVSSPMMMLASEPTGAYMLGITESNGAQSTTLDNNVYVFSIGTGGALSAQPTVVNTPETPSYIAVSPTGTLVLTFNLDDLTTSATQEEPIVSFSFNASTGALTNPTPSTTFLSSVGKFDQTGQYIFAEGSETNQPAAGLLAISVSSTGGLSSGLPPTGSAGVTFAVTDEP